VRKPLIGIGLGFASALVALGLGLLPFVQTIELKTYDWRMRATADPSAARTDIVLVRIDDESIHRLEPFFGRWPWPRVVHAHLLDYLARTTPKAVLYDVLFTEHDRQTFTVGGEQWTGEQSDAALAESASKLKVVFVGDATRERLLGTSARPDAVSPSTGYRLDESIEPRPWYLPPIPALVKATGVAAQDFSVLDPDGVMRRFPPFVRVSGQFIPSLAVAGAVMALGLGPRDVRLDDESLWIGPRRVPVITALVRNYEGVTRLSRRALINYRGVWPDERTTYRTYSFADLFQAEELLQSEERSPIDPNVFRDKVVIVGATAAALYDLKSVPFPGRMSGPEVHAAFLDSILSDRFLAQAPRAAGVTLTMAAAMAMAFIGVYLSPWIGTGVAIGGGTLLIALLTWEFAHGFWLPMVAPLVALAASTFGGVGYQYVVEGREKRRVKRLFSRVVPKDVYEQLLANPNGAQLGGQRRRMTVFFCDIRGFTTVSERGEPEAIVGQLNEYFSRMVPIVFAHRGTVDKFVGDMIMALFGAPLDDPEHADHAVQTALAMSAGLAQLNQEWTAAGKTPLDIGVGINTGDMVAGNLGSEQIMSYTVIGDNVNLAARLESLNKEYHTRIVISEATRAALRGRYDIRALGTVLVKGKTQPVEIHAVVPPQAVLDGLHPPAVVADTVSKVAGPPPGQES
jgi:adenylate cyclase